MGMQHEKEIVVYRFLLQALQKRFEFFGVLNLEVERRQSYRMSHPRFVSMGLSFLAVNQPWQPLTAR
jgi:hypothetical protein